MLSKIGAFIAAQSLLVKLIGAGILLVGLWFAKARYDRYQRDIGAEKMKQELLEVGGWETVQEFEAEREQILEDREAVAEQKALLQGEIKDKEDRLQALETELIGAVRNHRRSQQAFERRISELGIEVSSIADADLVPAVIGVLTRLQQRDPVEGDSVSSPPTGGDSGSSR